MTARLYLSCDVPGCTASWVNHGIKPDSIARERSWAKKEAGWNTTRVANPFHEGKSYQRRTYELDRCPQHTKVLLVMVKVADRRYDIQIKQPAKRKEKP